MKYIPITRKGYSLFDVSSALQKAIRRGEEKAALYWAYEIEQSGYNKYLWYRLRIVSIEDVGLANTDCHLQIIAAEESYETFRKRKSGATVLALVHAIILLVRSPKSRLSDWASCFTREVHNSHSLSIPDEALDKHTRRGRENGKTVEDFFATGCKLSDHHMMDGEEDYMEFVRNLWCETSQMEQDNFRNRAVTLDDDHPDRAGIFRKTVAQKQRELFESTEQ